MPPFLRRGLLVLAWWGCAAAAEPPSADGVVLPAVFSDHLVLQRDLPVPVWGTARAGAAITVAFRDQRKTATAAADGAWSVRLDPLAAGGPDPLAINGITINDVLVGEVWVGSGQSNMEFGGGAHPAIARIRGEPHPQVRYRTWDGRWSVYSQRGGDGFSAILLFFGLRLNQELKVPMGLMVAARAGSPSGLWLTEAMLKADPPAQEALTIAAAAYPARKSGFEAALARWEASIPRQEYRKPQAPEVPGANTYKTDQHTLGMYFDQRIKPMVGYGIRGVLWDQGESGSGIGCLSQYLAMGALIRGWRAAWGQGGFPFLYVQKPSGAGCAWDTGNPVTSKGGAFVPGLPVLSGKPSLPNPDDGTYVRMMGYANAGMVISSDLGGGLHPDNKGGYGYRAADVALGMVYGRPVPYYGPTYAAHAVDGARIRIAYTHLGAGLAFKGGDRLQGFAVAGDDRIFHWADAAIDGEHVVVSCPAVPKPVHVRYAWSETYPWANLFSRDGLPAIPFRTDGPDRPAIPTAPEPR